MVYKSSHDMLVLEAPDEFILLVEFRKDLEQFFFLDEKCSRNPLSAKIFDDWIWTIP